MSHDDLLRAAMTIDESLDDIKRAQIWAQLEARLDEPAPARRRWPLALTTAAVAAGLLGWLALRPAHPHGRTLTAPAETTLATSLGPHARAELIGPATVELVGPPGDRTSVRLRTGTLIAEFTGGPGRSLRIETRDAQVEIVGTLFAVDARDDATCVSVAHGKVKVTAHTHVIAVATGESWCSTRVDVQPLQPAVEDQFQRFEAVIVARGEAPVPPPAAAPPAEVAVAPTPAAVAVVPPPIVRPIIHHGSTPPTPTIAQRAPGALPGPTPEPAPIPAPSPAAMQLPVPPPPAAAGAPAPPATPAPAPPATPTVAPPATPAVAPPATPAVAPPATPAVAPPPATPESLYEAAEAALARRDAAGADRIFARLLADYPHATLADQALYERARIAYDRHAWRDAQHELDLLAAISGTPLAEPGAYLSCRIAIEAKDGAAERCLVDYRTAYPKSPHDLDVLGVLTDLAHTAGGCARARPRIDELRRTYPRSALARAWVARCPEAR